MKARSGTSSETASQSLDRRIEVAGSRLDRRKQTARGIGSSLGAGIRSRLASPDSLLIAASAGFLVGDWIHRPEAEPRNEGNQPSASKEKPSEDNPPRSNLISKALVLVRFGLGLKKFWDNAIPAGTGSGER